jgi:hypothetical protein
MSANYWAFLGIPGSLSIGGTNSGGFQICDGSNPHATLASTCRPPHPAD